MIKNCYIHIPFCSSICSYCDFCKILYREDIVDKYLDNLEIEIKNNYREERLETIYIGGGTPSCLNIRQLNRLFSIIKIFNKADNLEFTIECNFNSINKEKLDLFKKNGINRISFGIETINSKFYQFLNRYEDTSNIRKIIDYCKNIGITNINVDLMYAFKNECLNDVERDLDFIFSLNIKHVSTYSLIIEENTKLFIDGIKNISEDIDSDMYDLICKSMKSHNYLHYEISNFSKIGYFSRHNLCYWNNVNYYGFGLGASSYIKNIRINNTKSITKYLNGEYILNEEVLDFKDIIEYYIILGFRKCSGIDLQDFKFRYKQDLNYYYKYDKLVEDNLLILDNNLLYIPEDKLYLSNSIIVKILEGEVKHE